MTSNFEHSQFDSVSIPQPSVLVVDDHPELRHMFRIALEIVGFDVVEATSAMDAARRVGRIRPRVIILSLQWAETHGLDVLRHLRAQPRFQRVPIIFLAGEPTDDDTRCQALRAGADTFMSRPLSLHELQERVSYLGRTGRPHLRLIAGHSGEARRRKAG